MPEIFLVTPSFRTILAIGFLVLLLFWESAAPFFDFFKSRPEERTHHALRNLIVGAVNVLLTATGFGILWAHAAEWSAKHRFG